MLGLVVVDPSQPRKRPSLVESAGAFVASPVLFFNE